MDKAEVIARLKEHIRGKLAVRDKLSHVDKCYCINYIMDFLFCDRRAAKKIFENEVLI